MHQTHRFRFVALLLLFWTASTAWGQTSFGQPSLLNQSWKFILEDASGAEKPEFDDRTWEGVDLPHDWSVRGELSPDLASGTGYLPGGIGWYRKTIEIPSDREQGEKVFLYFEGVYNRSSVYLNGHLLGHRPNGYISFLYDATPYVRFDEPNTIAVRVDHSRFADSRWYTGSGIYRDVWLVRSQPVHLDHWGVFAFPESVDEDTALLRVETKIANESEETVQVILRHELVSDRGEIVARGTAKKTVAAGEVGNHSLSLDVDAPVLWSVDNPYLYQLRTTLELGGKIVDRTSFQTGIRTFAFDPDTGFSLNGVRMKMKGVCLHHDAGVLGAAVPREVWRERLLTLKSIGVNAIRTSHNPQAPDLYELCDELGLLVMNEAFDEWEFPKRKWIEGWNVGEPGFEGSYDFFEEWSSRDLADMVRRDRNHASVFAWSIGNEVDYPNDPYSHPILDGSEISQPMFGGYDPERPDANRLGAIAERLARVVKEHDTSRPVTAGLAGVVMSNQTGYPAALDIAGYNYTEDRYVIDHEQYPDRVIYGSENRHDYEAWLAVTDNDFIFGQFLWTGIDYLGESGAWPSRGFYSGLLDLGGFIKPRGRFREALWSEQPVIHLGTEHAPEGDRQSIDAWPIWNYEEGEEIRVLCYTNAETAELFLNGSKVGPARSINEKTGVISWDIAFEPGELEVVGYDASGVETVRNTLRTAGKAARLELSSNVTSVDRERGVAMIVAQVVDEEGTPVMGSTHEVQFSIEGPARLLGLEASNNENMSDYTDAVHNVYHGRILAYVQAEGTPGEVVVRFSGEGLPAADLRLDVR